MLPPGHVAGGYLAGKLASSFCTSFQSPEVLAATAFFGFFPDLDFFLVFAKNKKWISSEKINHRTFVSHAPLLYLLVFIIWYFVFTETRDYAWAFIIGTWSHFIIDTFSAEGILWLYPFSKKLINKPMDPKINITEQGFFNHWFRFVKEYMKVFSFKAEVTLILIALIVLVSR